MKEDFAFEGRENIADGATDCYTKFIKFIEDFSDIIFICGLVGSAIWNIMRMFFFGTLVDPEIITFHKWVNLLIVAYMLLFALIIYFHMTPGSSKHEFIEKYMGFVGDDYGKVFFLLFAACLVFPMDGPCPDGRPCENNDWANYVVGCGLSVTACVNIMGVCK